METVNILQAFCELPVDGIFMSISIIAAYTISKPENQAVGFVSTLVLIVTQLPRFLHRIR